MQQMTLFERWGRRAVHSLIIGLSLGALSACEGLLEVDLPHILTDAAIEDASSAEVQVNSAITLFECGYNQFGLTALGHENAMQSVAGVFSGGHVYDATPNTGTCDQSETDTSWFDQIMGARAILSTDPALFVATGTGAGRGVYDRIQNDWALGDAGERLSAISAIYVAMSLAHIGEFLCEAAIDGSELLTPPDVLVMAEAWANRALAHVTNIGDFVMPYGISTSARNMATAIRARIRWANQDLAGAAADATTVLASDAGFNAWITREPGERRRNLIYVNATAVGYSAMNGINDWWNPAIRRPNPATGVTWPSPIPFTGYIFLGVMPDGRTLEAGNVPVRWAEQLRDVNEDPISLANTAVADTRVEHIYKVINGPGKHELPDTYAGQDSDIPYMTWEELSLIQADRELELGNLGGAIAIVNTLRVDKSLPEIVDPYLSTLNTFDEVRALLLEERRREFFNEAARYWSTKIQNTDMLWFPRAEGATTIRGYGMGGGVRQLFTANEYTGNEYFIAAGGLDARGSGCSSLGSMFGNPGSQGPFPFIP